MRRLILLAIAICLGQMTSIAAMQLEDLTSPKELFYRLGTTDTPEIKVNFEVQPLIKPVVQKEVTVKDTQNLTYADLSIKKMALEISKSIDVDYNDMLADLSLLWHKCNNKALYNKS